MYCLSRITTTLSFFLQPPSSLIITSWSGIPCVSVRGSSLNISQGLYLTCVLVSYTALKSSSLPLYSASVSAPMGKLLSPGCVASPNMSPLPHQLRLGLLQLRSYLSDADSSNPVPYTEHCQATLLSNSTPSTLSRKVTTLIETYLARKSQLTAREFLLTRLAKVSWLGYYSPSTFDVLHRTSVKAIPSFSRLAILRWLILTLKPIPM